MRLGLRLWPEVSQLPLSASIMNTDNPRVPTMYIFCSLEPMTLKHIFVECESLDKVVVDIFSAAIIEIIFR